MSDKPEPPRCAVALAVALPQELPSAASFGVPFAYTGVGKVQAAIAVADLVHLHRPRLVLNFGSVGRVRPGPHGLLEVARVLQRDMLAEPLAPRGSTPFHDGPHALESGWPGVVCATGDSFVTGPDAWFGAQGVDVVDMELFAIAAVCRSKGIAWRALKFVSDDANAESGQDWAANLRTGAQLFHGWWQQHRAALGLAPPAT
jgi:adenosylhomocysteine nucleosidase